VNTDLHDTLFDLYMDGGLELMTLDTRGLKRELIIDLETSALTPEKGEIIPYRAVNRWDENDEFDEWARPSRPLSLEAERIVGVTNEQLSHCRSSDIIMDDFCSFIDGASLVGNELNFDLRFLTDAVEKAS
jgi:DNA polymerase-3 subunit epsilon